jgi:hypothetical protein
VRGRNRNRRAGTGTSSSTTATTTGRRTASVGYPAEHTMDEARVPVEPDLEGTLDLGSALMRGSLPDVRLYSPPLVPLMLVPLREHMANSLKFKRRSLPNLPNPPTWPSSPGSPIASILRKQRSYHAASASAGPRSAQHMLRHYSSFAVRRSVGSAAGVSRMGSCMARSCGRRRRRVSGCGVCPWPPWRRHR